MSGAGIASPESIVSGDPEALPRKRMRLSRACNRCRAKKIRCDEDRPSCRRCVRDGEVCITSNPKNPHQDSTALRKRAGSQHIQILDTESTVPRAPFCESTSLAETPASSSQTASEEPIAGSALLPQSRTIVRGNNVNIARYQDRTPVMNNADDLHARAGESDASFALNSVNAIEQKYLGPTSLQVYTQWLEMTFHMPTEGLTDRFRFGLRFCEEFELPEHIPQLQPINFDGMKYVQSFFSTLGLILPIVEVASVTTFLHEFSNASQQSVRNREKPAFAILYACMAIGAEMIGELEHGMQMLTAVYTLYPYLVAQPYTQSAQALLLMAVALRWRNKDGAAAQVLGQAIRIMQSLGFHKKLCNPPGIPSIAMELRRHIWWSAYCLERIMSFESGRPSCIHDDDMDQELPTASGSSSDDMMKAFVGLSRIQGRIIDRLYKPEICYQGRNTTEILSTQAELDCELQSWYQEFRDVLQLDVDGLSYEVESISQRAFLLIQFYSTMATVHRTALLLDPAIHRASVGRTSMSPASTRRLESSESICANAARKIVTVFLQTCESLGHSRYVTMTGPLTAVYVLAIYTLKHPAAWTAPADLSLLQSAAEVVEQRYRDGQDAGFYRMLTVLKQFASQGTLTVKSKQPPNILFKTVPTTNNDPHSNNSVIAQQTGELAFDENWDFLLPRLYLGDLDTGQLDSSGWEHMLGIPRFTDEELMIFASMQDSSTSQSQHTS